MTTEVPYWFQVEALADYWGLPYSTVRDELQQTLTLGEVGGFLCVEASGALAWAAPRYGIQSAKGMLDDLASLAVELPFEEVPLTEEYDSETDYERPIIL